MRKKREEEEDKRKRKRERGREKEEEKGSEEGEGGGKRKRERKRKRRYVFNKNLTSINCPRSAVILCWGDCQSWPEGEGEERERKKERGREEKMDKVNAECDGASSKPPPWRGMPVPGVGLQALTLQVCAFLGLHDATASPGAAPTGFAPSRISRWADAKENADPHTTTHLGKDMGPAAGPDQGARSRPAPSTERAPTTFRGTATLAEAKLEVRHTCYNALSLPVLHSSTPGDPQTIPTHVHFSVPYSCLQQNWFYWLLLLETVV